VRLIVVSAINTVCYMFYYCFCMWWPAETWQLDFDAANSKMIIHLL